MRVLVILFTLLSTFSTVHATSTIKGTIKKWSGKTGKVFKYQDFITYEKQQIAEIQLDANGYFELPLELEEYTRTSIDLEQKNQILHLQSGSIHTIGLVKNKLTLVQEENTHFNTKLSEYDEKILAIAEKHNKGGKKKKLAGYEALQVLKEAVRKEENEMQD